MSAEAFQGWLRVMGISAAQAGRLLGVHANTVTKYKRRGGDRILALACSAIYHRLEAWE